MSAKTIKYSQRLGDVLRCLPACKYLADQGHEVFFDCFPQYHGVFDLVSYVKAGSNGDVLDLEIWPNRYNDFIKSRKNWHDFVYSHPEIKEADKTNIVLDKLDDKPAEGLPETYHLVAPFGISQTFYRNPLELIQDAVKELGKDSVFVLCPPDIKIQGLNTYTAQSIEQMVKAIRGAGQFWAVNSSPIIIASAVRREKESKFWGEKNESEVQNVFHFQGLVRMD
jgi:UDP:flavonoid glycosyltransferase YjiC (YdhE family)